MAQTHAASEIALPHVDAQIYFAGDISGGRARSDHLNPATNNLHLRPAAVRIFDAMDIRSQLDLDREGFMLVDHASAAIGVRSLDNIADEQESFEPAYHDEICKLIRDMSGADVVIPHRPGLTVRISKGQASQTGIPKKGSTGLRKSGQPLVYEPAFMAHADYTALSFHDHTTWIPKREGVALRPFRRAALFHIWRPLSACPHDKPLTVCDGRTARPDGHVVMDAVAGPPEVEGNAFEVRIAAANSAIAWYYFSCLAPRQQVIVFKGYDTARPEQTVFHTAFQNGDPAARPRASIETRVFAFWH